MQEGCTEISLRLRKKFTGWGLDVRGSMCYLCIVNFNTALTEVMVIISLRLRKKITGGGLDVRWSMCYLCIVNLNIDLNEVMFDGNNLNEINPGVFLAHQLVFCGLFC